MIMIRSLLPELNRLMDGLALGCFVTPQLCSSIQINILTDLDCSCLLCKTASESSQKCLDYSELEFPSAAGWPGIFQINHTLLLQRRCWRFIGV